MPSGQEEVLKPRGEYGIWLRSPLGGDPLLVEGYGDNKEDWEGAGLCGSYGARLCRQAHDERGGRCAWPGGGRRRER